jgi:DNA-binding NarL/FixJ family response regulator
MKTEKHEKPVILVVEDSLIIREKIFSILEEIKSEKRVVYATNYTDSMRMIKELNANIVLLDIRLPGKNGIFLLRQIKEHYPDVKVIMLSNHAGDNYRKTCEQLGAEFFLDKSIEFEKIPDTVRLARTLKRA